MSSNNQINRSRDPRQRDRSRSELRRIDSTDCTCTTQDQPIPNSTAVDFFKALGINSQLIQALINANPPRIEQVQSQLPTVNNAQEFASFLSRSYGLDSPLIQSIHRDPRRRPNPSVTTQEPSKFQQTISTPLSIDETYKQYLSSINQSLLDDELRKRFQRIALLDSEFDKLHRMNVELSKNSERRSRQRSSTKVKDPLLKENEYLQVELMNYLKSLKTTMMINYPLYSLNNQTITRRQ
ncbi:unnamed protein product [Adineta ricciae]|uniref:Uncharacterized protein n=1 Tax=Adineta ricciae TaxID=249248 RepID=A0A815QT37_ADIRI|nr:unnamed protein product [Adineta ricciae]